MRSTNILIIEDERVAAETLALDLKQYNYQVLGIVNSGKEAIKRVAETKPDLILIDIVLQRTMNGIATGKKIQGTSSCFGYTSRIPKLFLSEFQLSPSE